MSRPEQVIIWIPTLNLIFSMIRYLNLKIIMYHIESSWNVKLSYLLSPGLLNQFLPKYNTEISSPSKSLGVTIQILIWHNYLHKKFRNSVLKDVKASKSDYFKNYFLSNKNMKKFGLELQYTNHQHLVKLKCYCDENILFLISPDIKTTSPK